jgi:hypothetical protein
VGAGSASLLIESSLLERNVAKQASQLSFLSGGPVTFSNSTVLMDGGQSQVCTRERIGSGRGSDGCSCLN